MCDNFLFNDDDPKQIGVGCDALCPDDKRLKFKWTWGTFNNGKPCQCSEAELENGWNLETLFWHTDYEACVAMGNRTVDSCRGDWDGSTPLVTRIDAQLKAEELFEKLGKDIVRQCL